jgi:hypothetical protein
VATFADDDKRVWVVRLNVQLLTEIEERTGVSVDRLLDPATKEMAKLADPRQLVRVLWVFVEVQAGKLGVSPEQFGRAIGGDALEAGFDALLDAIVNFFPARQRGALTALTGKIHEVADLAAKEATAAIAALDPASLASATNSPASSASTPAG